MLRINDPELKKIIEDALEKVAETDWDLEQRKEGYYETPIKYAELAHSYLKKVIPDRYNNNGLHHSMYDDYNWYDPCCGTGNLTVPCPPNMKGWLGMSTLYEEDIEMMREDNKNNFYANAFQYDFLNMKPRSEELEELIEMLRDDKKWIFILNPPYARSSGGKYAKKNEAQSRKIPETKTKEKMDKTGLRQISNQLSIQFLMILYAFQQYFHLDAFVVLFTPPKFFTSIGHRKFREIWDTSFTFQSGFCVNSKDFGTSNSWPILMSIWKSLPKVDLIDNNKKIGEKRLRVVEVEKRLSEWIESKPKNSEAIPCMNYLEKGDKIGKVSQNAIGYAICYENNVYRTDEAWIQQAAPYHRGTRWSIEHENFEKTLVLISIRNLIKKNVWNDNDEMSIPNEAHPEYEKIKKDIIAYGLLTHSINKASSLSLTFEDNPLDLPNEFFWMTKDEFLRIPELPPELHEHCHKSKERFAAQWFKKNCDALSDDCQWLLLLSKELVKVTIKDRLEVNTPRLQLDRWDAGWVQLKEGLFDNKSISKVGKIDDEDYDLWLSYEKLHEIIKKRLQPYVYELGVLEKEEFCEPTPLLLT